MKIGLVTPAITTISIGADSITDDVTPLAPLYDTPVEVYDTAQPGDLVTTFTPQPNTESGLPLTMSLESNPSGYFKLEANGGDYDLVVSEDAVEFIGAFDLSTQSAQVGSFITTVISSQIDGMAFKPDGTRWYYANNTNDRIQQVDMSTAWDIETSISSGLFNLSGMTVPRGVCLNATGTNMYVYGRSSGNAFVRRHALSTAWDIATSSVTSPDLSIEGQWESQGILVSADETKLYLCISNTIGDTFAVREYTMSTPGNLGTAILTNTFDCSAQIANQAGQIAFSDDGMKLFLCDNANNSPVVWEYSLAGPYDLSQAATAITGTNLGQSQTLRGLVFNPEGSKLFTADIAYTNAVRQYDIGSGEVSYLEAGETYPITVRTTEAGGKTQNEDLTVNVIESPLWTPEELTNVSSWYDAQDASTVTLNEFDDVTEWADKSAGGNPLTPYIAAGLHHEPGINGHDAIVWPVTNNTLALDDDTSGGSVNRQAVFMVLKFEDGTSSHWQASGQGGYPGIFGATNTSYYGFHGVHSVDYIGATTPYNNGFWRMNGSDPNQASTFDFLPTGEGQLIYAHATSATNFALRLGMDREFTYRGYRGAIGEVITLSGIPTDEDRQKVEGYLAWRWGLEGKLPADHPYKSAEPLV